MSVRLGKEARRWADGEVVSRVRARIAKGGEMVERAWMRLRPCLPVAPTMRSFLADILNDW